MTTTETPPRVTQADEEAGAALYGWTWGSMARANDLTRTMILEAVQAFAHHREAHSGAGSSVEQIAEAIWIGETQLKTDYPPKSKFADNADRERFLWLARYVAALSARPEAVEEGGWIVLSGDGKRFRTWKDGWSAWTDDRDEATRYARRQDAEAVHSEDEDAWSIVPFTPSPTTNAGGDREIARLREAILMVAIEKLAAIVGYDTPDDLTPTEVDNQRYAASTPIFRALGMQVAGEENPGWGFDWTIPSDIEQSARQALATKGGDA